MALAQTILNGLLIGGVMALGAIGFTLIFGVMGVLNLTHGAIVILGAYVSYFAWNLLGIDPFLSIPLSMLVMFALGYGYERLIIRHIVHAGDLVILLVTFGVAYVVRNLLTIGVTANSRSINPPYSAASIDVAGITLPVVRLGALVVSVVLILLVFWFIRYTSFGLAIRATAEDAANARLCGIDVDRVYAITFGLSTAIAAASGSLIGIIIPFSPASELQWTLNAFVVVVLGGLGNPLGSLLGGLLIGLVNAFTTDLLSSKFVNLVTFSLLILFLLVRPQGILGTEGEGV